MPLFCFTPFLPPLVGYAFLAVGLSLIRPFAESAFVGPRCLSVRVCLCAFALRVSSLCVLFFSPFALGLCDVWLWCCGCFPPSPLGCIRAVSWPSKFFSFAGPSLWVSGCFCDGLVALPCAWGVVVHCFLAAFCLMAAKALALCGVIDQPSTPWGICGCGALRSLTEVFIFVMIQDPPRTPLSYTLATLVECVTFSTLAFVCLPGALSFCSCLDCVYLSLRCPAPQCDFLLLHLGDNSLGPSFWFRLCYIV